jgi:hypothetical protein
MGGAVPAVIAARASPQECREPPAVGNESGDADNHRRVAVAYARRSMSSFTHRPRAGYGCDLKEDQIARYRLLQPMREKIVVGRRRVICRPFRTFSAGSAKHDAAIWLSRSLRMISALRRVIAAMDHVSLTRQAGRQSLGPCATTSSPGGARCSADPFDPIGHGRRAKLGAAAATRAQAERWHRAIVRPAVHIGPHARGRSTGKPTRTPWRRMLRASWDGLAPHPWPSNHPRTYRERDQVAMIGSRRGTNAVLSGLRLWSWQGPLPLCCGAGWLGTLSLPAHRQEPGAAFS